MYYTWYFERKTLFNKNYFSVLSFFTLYHRDYPLIKILLFWSCLSFPDAQNLFISIKISSFTLK